MEDYFYAYEKTMVAVDILATGTDTPRKRLEDAWISSLMRLRPCHFPPGDSRDLFEAVRRGFTGARPDGLRGSAGVAASRMTPRQARRAAEAIVSLFHSLATVHLERT